MIYLLIIALIFTAAGFIYRSRGQNWRTALLDAGAATVLGFIAGLLIGAGARLGMWAIVIANGREWNFSVSGSLNVVAVFACLGIAFGLIYEGLLRNILRKRGLIFGLLLTLGLWYPLGEAARQALTFQPPILSFILWTGIFVALIFMPYGVGLEMLLARWHGWHRARVRL